MDDIFDFVKVFFTIMLGLVLFIVLVYLTITGFGYVFDKSNCTVYVNQKQVYAGRTHYLNIHSIGENGNTKHLTIYKDIFCLKPLKHYVSNDIEVREW
jgi:hypothetical protein